MAGKNRNSTVPPTHITYQNRSTKKYLKLTSFYGLNIKTIDIAIVFQHTINKEVSDMIIRPNYN